MLPAEVFAIFMTASVNQFLSLENIHRKRKREDF
jgi:hypothetical protein